MVWCEPYCVAWVVSHSVRVDRAQSVHCYYARPHQGGCHWCTAAVAASYSSPGVGETDAIALEVEVIAHSLTMAIVQPDVGHYHRCTLSVVLGGQLHRCCGGGG